jgi:hypothetical protein
MRTLLQLTLVVTATILLSHSTLASDHNASASADLTMLLNDFLAGASRGDPTVHERFWDDELVYTSSAGARTDKAKILASMQGTEPTNTPAVVYSADDIDIRLYDDVAIVAFTLVATPQDDDVAESTSYYLNTGTFRWRNGEWRAIAWQATRVPE